MGTGQRKAKETDCEEKPFSIHPFYTLSSSFLPIVAFVTDGEKLTPLQAFQGGASLVFNPPLPLTNYLLTAESKV